MVGTATKSRIAVEMDEADAKRLREEAHKRGVGNVSSLIRILIKQFFAKIDKGGDAISLT